MKRTHPHDDKKDFNGARSRKKACRTQDQKKVTMGTPSSDAMYLHRSNQKDIALLLKAAEYCDFSLFQVTMGTPSSDQMCVYGPCRKDIGLLLKAAEYLGDFPLSSLNVDVNSAHCPLDLSSVQNGDKLSRLSPPSSDSDTNSQSSGLPTAQYTDKSTRLSPDRSDSDTNNDTASNGKSFSQNGGEHTTLSPPDTDVDDSNDDPNLITCWCRKPHGQRNMILCNSCNRWLHFSCVKIRKDPNPGSHYTCTKCVAQKQTQRKSERRHIAKARFDT